QLSQERTQGVGQVRGFESRPPLQIRKRPPDEPPTAVLLLIRRSPTVVLHKERAPFTTRRASRSPAPPRPGLRRSPRRGRPPALTAAWTRRPVRGREAGPPGCCAARPLGVGRLAVRKAATPRWQAPPPPAAHPRPAGSAPGCSRRRCGRPGRPARPPGTNSRP